MGKIVMSGPQNVSLDGVVQDPDGEEGFRLGGWFGQFGGKDLEAWNEVALEERRSVPRRGCSGAEATSSSGRAGNPEAARSPTG